MIKNEISKGRRKAIYECIVIGVSAGGVETLTLLLPRLPEDFSIPVIVVQHVSKEQTGYVLTLDKKCNIKVKEVSEKEKIEPGTAYLAPANYHLLIEENRTFVLDSDEKVNFSRPSIDVLFESAAEVYREKLVGIILTGSNSDGAQGIRMIKSLGGVTIAQNPESAKYKEMPQSGIDTGMVDHIMDLEQIYDFLIQQQN